MEAYLAECDAVAPVLVIELAYRQYCLLEQEGAKPEAGAFLGRFTEHRDALERLLAVHQECSPDELRAWFGPEAEPGELPEAGDEIGPYLLRRELGCGAFARVFLAEQVDLENRQVVVKVSARRTREPWLLARARHTHIVEILLHTEVNDGAFQLICMPFLGGATLSSVLNHRRQNGAAQIARGGLLRDLDAVAAPEYEGVNLASPARVLLSGSNDARALAWITARLAEALDHAYNRKVAHGDVKPSNILLTADGNPMLLDFNLAQDWSPLDGRSVLPDGGGTLVYMAPERLRAIAAATASEPAGEEKNLSLEDESDALTGRADPHRCDLFAMGMVLLEALTTAPPPADAPTCPADPALGLTELAGSYAIARERGARTLIEEAEARTSQRIPRGLHRILERCLAASPSDRYRRALELAEDLDRWRTDRPLAYTRERFWTETLPRWFRRNSRPLAVAGLVFVVCLITTWLVMRHSEAIFQGLSLQKLARRWDSLESNVFQFQRPGGARLKNPEMLDARSTAADALRDYDVLGSRDWRRAAEIQHLPTDDRADLELWLMEQAYRYARTLCLQANAPAEWTQAAAILDHVDPAHSLSAMAPLRDRLREQIARQESSNSAGSGLLTDRSVVGMDRGGNSEKAQPPWVDEYLLGVSAELEAGTSPENSLSVSTAAEPRISRASTPELPRAELPPHDGTAEALRHYQRVLTLRPKSFWSHYRSAVVCFRLQRWSDAASHLEYCLMRRPDNAALRAQFAACLRQLKLFDEALRECNRAIELAPKHGEFYRSRAFIHATRGQTDSVADDLQRFEMFVRAPGQAFLHHHGDPDPGDPRTPTATAARALLAFEPIPGLTSESAISREDLEAMTKDELDARAVLAANLSTIGGIMLREESRQLGPGDPVIRPASPADPARVLGIAAAEFGKVLTLDPRHINARFSRMMQALEQGEYQTARNDLERIMEHPGLDQYLTAEAERHEFLHGAQRFASYGFVEDAERMVEQVLELTIRLKLPRGRSLYFMARVQGFGARTDATRVELAAINLHLAFIGNIRYRQWYREDHVFDPIRGQLDNALEQVTDPPVNE